MDVFQRSDEVRVTKFDSNLYKVIDFLYGLLNSANETSSSHLGRYIFCCFILL
jgi:hypothetical protein